MASGWLLGIAGALPRPNAFWGAQDRLSRNSHLNNSRVTFDMETNELYLSIKFDCKSDKVGVVVGFRVSELPGCVDIGGSLLVEGCT